MEYTRVTLPSFCVIGMEGSTSDGENFIQHLWDKANSRFNEVAQLAICDESGAPGVWGLMSDMSMSFRPWEENFTRGRYLAGVEVSPCAEAPEGWAKWVSPAYEYIVAPNDSPDAFPRAIEYIAREGLTLAGAAYDRIVPGKGGCIYLPVKKL